MIIKPTITSNTANTEIPVNDFGIPIYSKIGTQILVETMQAYIMYLLFRSDAVKADLWNLMISKT